jgi:SAM-dependent methyltransferase
VKRKRYFDAAHRAEFSWKYFAAYHYGRVLDVGSGGSAVYYREVLGSRYVAADISSGRATPDVLCDFERRPLPFASASFDTVICYDVLEHVDYPHRLFDELARVSRRYVIVALPNNWPGTLWNIVGGHNFMQRTGYGLPADEPPPGQRHKWFFNIEEAERFLRHRASAAGMQVREIEYVYERTTDAFLRIEPLRRAGVPGYPSGLGIRTELVRERRPGLVVPFLLFKYGVLKPLGVMDELLKRAIWGVGTHRYENVFCRQLWAVLEKPAVK